MVLLKCEFSECHDNGDQQSYLKPKWVWQIPDLNTCNTYLRTLLHFLHLSMSLTEVFKMY